MRAYVTLLWALLAGLLMPSVALAQAAQVTASFAQRVNTDNHLEAQLIRCDNSTSIAGGNPAVDGPIGGEACEAGDWSTPLDCRDMRNITAWYFEYSAAGSSEAKIWSCLRIPTSGTLAVQSTLGGTMPGVEAPGGAPSAADPDPLCVSLDDALSVTIDGANPGVQMINLSGQELQFIVGEIQACTDCDSTLVVSCGR